MNRMPLNAESTEQMIAVHEQQIADAKSGNPETAWRLMGRSVEDYVASQQKSIRKLKRDLARIQNSN